MTEGSRFARLAFAGVAAGLAAGLGIAGQGLAQQPAEAQPDSGSAGLLTESGEPSPLLLNVPVSDLYPGSAPEGRGLANPVANDPEAAARGMNYYNQFNCVGCHAPNGAGGMGPALSNRTYIYGSEPANIYLSILQGRPNGMPAWAGVLPDQVIWDLVAYVQSISRSPDTGWGSTTSVEAFKIEQVPGQATQTADPWQHTRPFSFGRQPEKP